MGAGPEAAHGEARQGLLWLAIVIGAVTASVLLLSAAGIHAMVSFTVTRRRGDIGIRSALGGSTARILGAVLTPVGVRFGAGVAVGLLLAAGLNWAARGSGVDSGSLLLLPGVALLITIVGLVAAIEPARRGLTIQPREVLQEE